MHTIVFGPINSNTSLPGLDYALTLLSLEQPVNLIFLFDFCKHPNNNLVARLSEKLSLLSKFPEPRYYLPGDRMHSSNLFEAQLIPPPQLQQMKRINDEELRSLMLKSCSVYNF